MSALKVIFVLAKIVCGMKGCGKTTIVISPIGIEWFYKIRSRVKLNGFLCFA